MLSRVVNPSRRALSRGFFNRSEQSVATSASKVEYVAKGEIESFLSKLAKEHPAPPADVSHKMFDKRTHPAVMVGWYTLGVFGGMYLIYWQTEQSCLKGGNWKRKD